MRQWRALRQQLSLRITASQASFHNSLWRVRQKAHDVDSIIECLSNEDMLGYVVPFTNCYGEDVEQNYY